MKQTRNSTVFQNVGLAWLLALVVGGAVLVQAGLQLTRPSGKSESAASRRTESIQLTNWDKARALHPTKNIEDIRIGDIVMAMNESTGEMSPKRVAWVFKNYVDSVYAVTIRAADGQSDQTIRATDVHPFFVPERGWVEASELQPGDSLLESNRKLGTVVSVVREDARVAVYNFEVEDFHTYFVSASEYDPSVLAHNSKKCMHVGDSGHHVPAIRKMKGRPFEVGRGDKTRPTLHPRGPNADHDHWRLHEAEKPHIGGRQGDFDGTDEELFDAYRAAYEGLDDIRVDVRSPNGTHNLGEDVSPREAVDLIEDFLRQNGEL